MLHVRGSQKFGINYQGLLKATISGVSEDLKFKFSKDLDQAETANRAIPGLSNLPVFGGFGEVWGPPGPPYWGLRVQKSDRPNARKTLTFQWVHTTGRKYVSSWASISSTS